MGLIHRDHVVEQVAATAFDPALGNSVLPGTFERSSHQDQAHRPDCDRSFQSILAVTVEDQDSLTGLIREHLAQLLDDPSAGRPTTLSARMMASLFRRSARPGQILSPGVKALLELYALRGFCYIPRARTTPVVKTQWAPSITVTLLLPTFAT